MEEAKASILALLQREASYQTVDYVNPQPSTPKRKRKDKRGKNRRSSGDIIESIDRPDLVHMLEECASLVMDARYQNSSIETASNAPEDDTASAASETDSPSQKQGELPKSPSSVSLRGVQEVSTSTHYTEDIAAQQPLPNQDFGYWRRQMFDWACTVMDSFEMDRTVVLPVAFNMLDRYVALEMTRKDSPAITRDDFQLFAMTCLYTAVKMYEPYPRKIAVEALVAMSRDFYSEHDVCATERDILQALQWRVNPPTAVAFCRLYEQLLPSRSESLEQASAAAAPYNLSSFSVEEDQEDLEVTFAAMAELAAADDFFLKYKDSTIGLAAFLHAARITGRTDAELQTLLRQVQEMTGGAAEGDDLEVIYRRLERIYC